MRRLLVTLALPFAVLVAAVALGAAPLPTRAQTGTPMAGQGFVGAWRVTVTPTRGPAFVTLSTFGADGTVLSSGAPVMPAPAGSPAKPTFGSTGHGAWRRTGPDTANVIFVALQSDGAGRFVGTVTVQGTLRLGPDGQTWDGTFVTTIANPAGKAVARFVGRVHATRITVQPLASPMAGTPAA